MQIDTVESFTVGTPEPNKGGFNWVFLKVTTDDGLVGWGECNWADYRARTLAAAIEELSDVFLVGFDPFNVENIREELYRGAHFLHVPDVILSQVMSAFEMACWDVVGKALGEPVYKLLGGRCHDALRSYTYIHYKWMPPAAPEAAAEAAREYVDMGFSGLKVDPIWPVTGPRNVPSEELNYAVDVVAAIREEVGDDVDILVGTHGQLFTQAAIRFARKLEPYDPLWLEEPVAPENVDEMARVATSTTVPVATGERVTTPHHIAALLETNAAQIVQPNVGLLGLLGAKKVAGMCETHYTQIAPWMYCGPVAGAANVQLGTCSPNLLIVESIEDWSWFHNDILKEPMEWVDGDLVPPDRPGLGVEPDETVLADHPFNEHVHPYERQRRRRSAYYDE